MVFAVIVGCRKWNPRIPGALIAVAGSIAASWLLDLQAHGLPVVAHSHRPEEIRRGIAAGVDNFEHTGLGTMPEYPDDVWELLKGRANTLYWTPTITPLPDIDTTDGSTVEHFIHDGGQNGVPVQHFKVIGGGHTWPGSAIPDPGTNYDIDASATIWNFFSKYDINGVKR